MLIRTIMITVLTIGVIGTGYWGYQEHQEKNAILIKSENNYQRAFHDLSFHVDLLHDKIGTALAMNSRKSLSPALIEVWRLTSEAQADVGQLPLGLLPFNKTEEFLAKIGEFSYRVAVRDLEKDPLSDSEYNTLKQLYKNSAEIEKELRSVQALVIENNLRWMDVDLALASENEPLDNTIIDGLKTVEKNMESYAEVDFGPAMAHMAKEDNEYKYLTGDVISADEAKKIAKDFLDIKSDAEMDITESGDGANTGFFSLTIHDEEKESKTYMDITKKGGYPIWVIQNREMGEVKLSLDDAAQKAEKYLKDHDFENLIIYESSQYDNVGVFTFVREQDGVRIYPESIRMKVGLDDGKVVGFSARDYLMTHHQRDIPDPNISVESALDKINPNVEVMDKRLAIIQNDLKEDTLCYEILGTIDQTTYRIFINATSGLEEKVERLSNAEPIYNTNAS